MDFDDYLAILRRRWLWLAVPAVVAPLIAFGVSLRLPERYVSQTLVLVEQQKVPDDYVKPVITEDLNARLASMREEILSRTRLQPIIERFGLYEKQRVSMEEKIDTMRKAVSVRPIRSDIQARTRGLPGFFIAFTADNPRVAQQVCGEISSMFVSENLKAREQSAVGTTAFLAKQLEDAKRNLDEQDAKLAVFQRKYIGQLPGQEQSSMNMLTTLSTQLDATTQALNRLEQDRTYTESMLAQGAATHSVTRPVATAPDAPRDVEQLEATLGALRSKYTDDHPDVIKAKRDLAILKARREEEKKTRAERIATNEVPDDPNLQQLRATIESTTIAIKNKRAEQQRLQQQIAMYQRRLEMSPAVQEESKKLTRDYQTALQFYNDLLTKKNQSEMATDLERRQQGEQFRVMDPPNLPERPEFPNRRLFAGGGFAVGLMIGMSIILLFEWLDRSVRSERDIELWLKLPTLGFIPQFSTDVDTVARGGANSRQISQTAAGRRLRAILPAAKSEVETHV